jgi:hypothetical protein
MLKIAKERPLPRFRRHRTRAYGGGAAPTLLLLRDPFSHYADHAVEDAATALFHATGEHAHVLSTISAGAALLSKGFLSEPVGARQPG